MNIDALISLRVPLLSGGFALALHATPAAAEQRFYFDVAAGGSESRNPFLQTGDNTSAAAAFVQVAPHFGISDEVSEVTLDSTLRYNRYSRHYGDDASAYASLQAERRLSPQTLLRAHASGHVSRTSVQDFLAGRGVGQSDPGAPAPLPDVTFAGTRSRTIVLDAGVGLDHDLNERDRLEAGLAVTSTQFSQASQSDYRFATGDMSFRRSISERTSAFAAVRIGYSDFLKGKLSDGVFVSPTVGIATQLSPRLNLEGGLGVSYSRVNDLGGRKNSRLVPSGWMTLCERIVQDKGCFKLTRGSQPTAQSGLTTVTTAGFTYSKLIGLKDQLGASATYTRNDQPGTQRSGDIFDLLTASATYDRSFNRRFALYLTPSYARLLGTSVSRRSDLAVLVGVRYRFGSVE